MSFLVRPGGIDEEVVASVARNLEAVFNSRQQHGDVASGSGLGDHDRLETSAPRIARDMLDQVVRFEPRITTPTLCYAGRADSLWARFDLCGEVEGRAYRFRIRYHVILREVRVDAPGDPDVPEDPDERRPVDATGDLLALSPAAGLIEVVPGRELDSPVHLPRGTMIRVELEPTAVRELPRVAIFTSLEPVTLLPLEALRVVLSPQAGHPLEVDFRLRCALEEPVELAFLVRRHGDHASSLALFAALRSSLRSVTLARDGLADEVLTFQFGPADDDRPATARVRCWLHHPEQTLRLRVCIPAVPNAGVVHHLQLHLDDQRASGVALTADCLRLFVVPVENLWSDLAAPIVYDGTADLHAIRIGAARRGAELVRVLGVDELGDGPRSVAPLAPGLAYGYEVLRTDGGATPMLRLRLAPTLAHPIRLSVEAQWSQPSLWENLPGRVILSLQQRSQPVGLRLLGPIRRPAPRPADSSGSMLSDLVASLRAARGLSRDQIVELMEVAGASADSPFRGLPALLDRVDVGDVLDPRPGGGSRFTEYRLGWRPVDGPHGLLLEQLASWVAMLLGALAGRPVRVVSSVPKADDRE